MTRQTKPQMARVVELVMLTIGMLAATAVCGWWGVGIAALVWGAWAGRARVVAVAAVCAWSGVLVWTAGSGAFGTLITELGQIARAPGWVLVVATVVYPGVLAWSAAVVGRGVMGETRKESERGEASGMRR
jgi:hypothetical protein